MSSFPLTNSYFSRWLKPPTSSKTWRADTDNGWHEFSVFHRRSLVDEEHVKSQWTSNWGSNSVQNPWNWPVVSNVDIWSRHVTINFKMMISCDNILGWVGVGTIDQQRFLADAFHEKGWALCPPIQSMIYSYRPSKYPRFFKCFTPIILYTYI